MTTAARRLTTSHRAPDRPRTRFLVGPRGANAGAHRRRADVTGTGGEAPYAARMPYGFDDERDPAIYMRLHGWLADADLQRMFADLDALIARERTFAVVLDCSELRVPELGQIRSLVGWFRRNFDAANRWHRGVACVITTPLLRGSLETAMQLQRMPMPVRTVKTADAGFGWVAAKLEASRSGSYRTLTARGP
jgi:hypothetical protein